MRNFGANWDGSPLISYQVESQGAQDKDVIVDCDFKRDESTILITFSESKVAFLNLIEKSIKFFEISNNTDTSLVNNVTDTGILYQGAWLKTVA